MNCLSVFDHFVGLALKGLNFPENEVFSRLPGKKILALHYYKRLLNVFSMQTIFAHLYGYCKDWYWKSLSAIFGIFPVFSKLYQVTNACFILCPYQTHISLRPFRSGFFSRGFLGPVNGTRNKSWIEFWNRIFKEKIFWLFKNFSFLLVSPVTRKKSDSIFTASDLHLYYANSLTLFF